MTDLRTSDHEARLAKRREYYHENRVHMHAKQCEYRYKKRVIRAGFQAYATLNEPESDGPFESGPADSAHRMEPKDKEC